LLKALPQRSTVVAFAQADHNDVSDDPGYVRALQAFLR
ncbi:alpha/beta hydrolase, partial [Pantoea dispersa]